MSNFLRTLKRAMLRGQGREPVSTGRLAKLPSIPERHQIVKVSVDVNRNVCVSRGGKKPKKIFRLVQGDLMKRVGRWRIMVIHSSGNRTLFDLKRNVSRLI
mgnify:FL=1